MRDYKMLLLQSLRREIQLKIRINVLEQELEQLQQRPLPKQEQKRRQNLDKLRNAISRHKENGNESV